MYQAWKASVLFIGMLSQWSVAQPSQYQSVMDCVIHPSQVVRIASPIDGVLSEVLVKPGEAVEAGEVIARIDSELARADLASAQLRAGAQGALNIAAARVEAAGKRFRRARPAMNEGVVTEIEVDEAEAEMQIARQQKVQEQDELRLAESEAKRMELLVQKASIVAPVTGVVGETLMNVGEAVRNQAIAELVVVAPMRVETYVPLNQLSFLREHEGGWVLQAGSDGNLRSTPVLDYISPVADASSGTVKVFFLLTDPKILPGMRCRLTPATPVAKAG